MITPVTVGNNSGTLVWSLSPSSLLSTSGVTFDPATGMLTVALHTALSVADVAIVAIGPTGLSASRSFAISVTPWDDPKFTTDYVTESHDTITGAYVLAGPTVQQASSLVGTLVWLATPSSLSSILNTSTGALSFPLHYSFPTQDVTLTATGPSGKTESDTFSLTIVPYVTPVIQTIATATVYTGPGAFALAAPTQTAANTGTIAWSLSNISGVPAGVSIDPSTGVITVSQNSVFVATSITVKATGPVTTIYGTTTFQLSAALWAMPAFKATIATLTGTNITTDAFDATTFLTTTTGTGTLAWSLVSAPTGVTINGTSGIITVVAGSPVVSQTFTVIVGGPAGGTSKNVTMSLTTYNVPAFKATIATLTGNNISTDVTFDATTFLTTTTGTGTLAWSLVSAPTGVTINGTSGIITVVAGSPVVSQTFTVIVGGPAGGTSKNVTMSLTTYNVPAFKATIATLTGNNISTDVTFDAKTFLTTTTGTGTLTWSLASAPTGVTINGTSGIITATAGSPVVNQTCTVIVNGPVGGASKSVNMNLTTLLLLQTYSTVGSFTSVAPTGTTKADVLIVAGGGGGSGPGNRTGGGGGGGGVLFQSAMAITAGNSYAVVVGAGGAGGVTVPANLTIKGFNGGNSQFATYIAVGGGGGGTWNTVTGEGSCKSGGSGGGVWHGGGGAGAGTTGQGNAGGASPYNNAADLFGGTGGGGAGGIGSDASAAGGGAGGAGASYNITGTAVLYGAGGGGSMQSMGGQNKPGGTGGTGGGGAGAKSVDNASCIQGGDATGYGGGGGGGGGSGTTGVRGGNGFSGIVVIKYS